MFVRIVCIVALFVVAGCTGLDEEYSTNYGLTSTEYPQSRSTPLDDPYAGGTVGIQKVEEYEQKYQKKDIIEHAEPAEPAEE